MDKGTVAPVPASRVAATVEVAQTKFYVQLPLQVLACRFCLLSDLSLLKMLCKHLMFSTTVIPTAASIIIPLLVVLLLYYRLVRVLPTSK